MRLIRCYIENFGGLQQYQLDFSPTITTVNAPNGFGKSTLAAFIRAMFYGMPRSAKSLEHNDRKRYSPWQGGLYGGWLEFEFEEVSYRVERSFGPTPKQDSFNLYTLTPFAKSNRFSENLGEEIFQLNAESFERTTYLPQIHWGESFITSELQAHLTNLIENTDDMGSFDTAIQTLRTQRSKFLPYRGKGGSINQISEQIAEMQMQISHSFQLQQDLQSSQLMLQEAEKQLATKQEELVALREDLNTSYNIIAQNALAAQYAALQAHENKLYSDDDTLLIASPSEQITDEDLNAFSDAINQLERTEAWRLYPSEQERLKKLDHFFSSGVPSHHALDKIQADIQQIDEIHATKKAHSDRLDELHPEKKRTGYLFFLILAFVCAASAGIMYYYRLPEYILYCAVVAGISLPTGLILLLLRTNKIKKIHALQDKINSWNEAILQLECELNTAFDPYFQDIYDYNSALKILSSHRSAYLELSAKEQELSEQRTRYQEHANARINQILSKYGLNDLPHERHSLSILQEMQTRGSILAAQRHAAAERLKSFEDTYGQPQQRPLLQTPDTLKHRETELIDQLNALQNTIPTLKQHIFDLQRDVEMTTETEAQIKQLQETQAHQLAKVKALDKAIEHLHSARQNLSEKYVEPVSARFSEYLARLMHIDSGSIHVDHNFNVTLENMGVQRELGYFSVGQVDMIALSMRFALVDILYGDHSPLLILDDPFVNLDNESTQHALELLEQLSQTHQILYLTCHDSRTI